MWAFNSSNIRVHSDDAEVGAALIHLLQARHDGEEEREVAAWPFRDWHAEQDHSFQQKQVGQKTGTALIKLL